MAGVLLFHGDDDAVVEDAFKGKFDIDDFGENRPKQRQEQVLRRLSEKTVFHWRPPDNGCGVDRLFAPGDALHMKYRIHVRKRVVAGMIAERTFFAEFVRFHIAFKNKVRIGGHKNIAGKAGHEFHRRVAQKTREQGFINKRREGGRGRVGQGRFAAESHCHGHTLARRRVPFVIAAAVLVQVPVHPGCLFVVDLHPIHADILDAAFRIAREHQRKRDEAPAVSGPALQNGQRVKIRFLNHFLTGGLVHLAGGPARGAHQIGKQLHLRPESFTVHDGHEFFKPLADFIQPGDAERDVQALIGAERVDQHREFRTFHLLEKQGGAASLADAVRDFGDFEIA